MTVEVNIFFDDKLLISNWKSVVEFDQVWNAYTSSFRDIKSWTQMVEITNLEDVTKFQITARNLRDAAVEIAGWLETHKIAATKVIIAPDDLSFGMAQVYYAQASFSAHETVCVVRSRDEAADFLEMAPAQLDLYLDDPAPSAKGD